jgi:hypothetical protein
MYWLPPGGIGNGLDAHNWAELVDTGASDLVLLLERCAMRASPRTRRGPAGWAGCGPRRCSAFG